MPVSFRRTSTNFLGVPFYRCDLPQDSESKESLFSANLGPTGLALVHAYGTAETGGLEVEQEATNPSLAARDMIVHGAYALALWDRGALYGYSGVELSG